MFREDSLCAVLSEIAKAQEMNMREGVKMLLELPERDIYGPGTPGASG